KSQATRTDLEVLRLKNELALQKDSYRSLIEEYEVASEQLTSAHEEVLSTNEELQSANEELETAKEELQVGNEELSASNQELTLVNTDLTNFSASMGVASLMLSPDLRIRRITPLCSDVLKILPADVGRPLADIRLAIDVASLPELLEAALRRGTVSVQEVTDRDGRWYRVQVRPYRSADHKIEGAVLSFFDVDDLKKKEREADELRREAETLNAVGQKLAAELDVKKLVQVVTDAAASLTGAQFGAFFYSVTGSDGESYVLSTIPGVSREHFSKSPLPRNTALFEATSRGAGVVRLDDVGADPRYGTTASLFGEPKGQLPVASYLAVPVVSREGKVLGGLFFGHAEPGRFLPKHERLAVGLASQAAVAIDNARLYADVAQREQELSDFFENASVGCHWVGPDGTILRANRAELRMLGYSKAEYVGRHIAEFHVDRPVIDDILRRLAANEVIRDYPARMRTKDGQIREVLIDSSVLWTDGKFVHTRCFTRDVTDLRRAQAADARLAALVASSDDPIVSKTLDGIITSWNKAAERMFGYSEKEVVGKSITVLFPEARLDEEREILAKLRRGESIEHYETERRRKDGSLVQVSLTVSPIRDAQGRILGASKIARDITERKRVEAEIRRLNADLERRVHERTASLEAAVRELDAFAYTIAHDLRAPLRAVHGFGQLLLEEYQGVLDEKAKGYVSQMIQGGSRMDALITDLLSYSRLNRQEVVLEALPLEVEVDRALEELKTDLAERGAVVAVKRPLPRVRGHAVTLKQAILNLVANAAKFVAPGTKPRITLWAERRPAAAAGARPTVRLWVEDNGIGIDPRYHDRLFRVFERLNPHEKYPGTGIGLAIVRRSIEKMGGRAGLESALGQGSRFWIELDAAEDAVASN
ncbi:MAG TPA: PAS domain S-box protein, partial [Planctomycetota bacterium]|nr:PAS domain S-box protein [Planctomycetota bacterium]